jgi:hypothetical protein
MSDRPIQVGDLVQLVRPCKYCGSTLGMGSIFTVESIITEEGDMECCDAMDTGSAVRTSESEVDVPLWCLKRIPPLSELEGVRTEETIKETA